MSAPVVPVPPFAHQDESLWLKIGSTVQAVCGVDVMLHLTCHLPVDRIKQVCSVVCAGRVRTCISSAVCGAG